MRKIKLPKPIRKKIDTTHTAFHCVYWTHATLSDIGPMTPIYIGLLGLTLFLHFAVSPETPPPRWQRNKEPWRDND